MQKLIYLADDELDIRELVKAFLEKEGYLVEAFKTGDLLYDSFLKKECDLIILDIMMPGNSGFVICSKIREISSVPIIMLTAKDTEEDYISGLSFGGDDYLTKPFSMVKLTMRVKTMLRRIDMDKQTEDGNEELRYENVVLYPSNLTAYCHNELLSLTRMEFKLLAYLIENHGKAVSRHELLNTVWGYGTAVESRATDDTVKRLRRKLDSANSNISIDTVWGHGFMIRKKNGEKK